MIYLEIDVNIFFNFSPFLEFKYIGVPFKYWLFIFMTTMKEMGDRLSVKEDYFFSIYFMLTAKQSQKTT